MWKFSSERKPTKPLNHIIVYWHHAGFPTSLQVPSGFEIITSVCDCVVVYRRRFHSAMAMTAVLVTIWEWTDGLISITSIFVWEWNWRPNSDRAAIRERLTLFTVVTGGEHEIYRSMSNVMEVIKLQLVVNLIETRFLCYKGMYSVGDSNGGHQETKKGYTYESQG